MTKFLKIKKLVSRHTKGFQAINEHMLLQNCGDFPDTVVFSDHGLPDLTYYLIGLPAVGLLAVHADYSFDNNSKNRLYSDSIIRDIFYTDNSFFVKSYCCSALNC